MTSSYTWVPTARLWQLADHWCAQESSIPALRTWASGLMGHGRATFRSTREGVLVMLDPSEVLDAKMYLSRIREWPAIPADINPERWLSGFEPHNEQHALAVLDSMIFISTKQTEKLFTSTVHSLSGEVATVGNYAARKAQWLAFLQTSVFTAPTGEEPSPTDSGFIFQRLARKSLGIDERRILALPDIQSSVLSGGIKTIVLVDDFAGSGNQFMESWTRQYWHGRSSNLAKLANDRGLTVYYLPLVATDYAMRRIQRDAPSVLVRPAHILADEYAIGHPTSVAMPDHLRASAPDFIVDASAHAGIAKYSRGFHNLELALAFAHSIPDACIGVLWSEEGQWFPLMAKK